MLRMESVDKRRIAVRAQEFFFIEHLRQHAAEFGFRRESPRAATVLPVLADRE